MDLDDKWESNPGLISLEARLITVTLLAGLIMEDKWESNPVPLSVEARMITATLLAGLIIFLKSLKV